MTGEEQEALLLEHRTWQLLRAMYEWVFSSLLPSKALENAGVRTYVVVTVCNVPIPNFSLCRRKKLYGGMRISRLKISRS
jgi:hypothetical protein